MLLLFELTLLILIKAAKVNVQLVARDGAALHELKMVKDHHSGANILPCLCGLVWWWCSCGAATTGGHAGERGLTVLLRYQNDIVDFPVKAGL